jgi:HEAT repeat protein
VREAAVTALRIIPDARADEWIAARMLKDPDPAVRRSAIFASSFRRLDPLLPALVQTMANDPENSVRLDAVRLIGENRNEIPSADVLLAQASQDRSTDVRQAAAGFLKVIGSAR